MVVMKVSLSVDLMVASLADLMVAMMVV